MRAQLIILSLCVADGLVLQPLHASRTAAPASIRPYMCAPPEQTGESAAEDVPEVPPSTKPKQYDVSKLTGSSGGAGAGFNQFDPVLTISGFISRRFGIVGGLAVVAILASTEGAEIVKSLGDKGPVAGSGETITTASGLQYVDMLVGTTGDKPMPGTVVGFNAVVKIDDKVLFDTRNDKPVAFKLGQRPFQNIVCEGVEEGLKGMRVGGKRTLLVPSALAPKGLELPPGVPLTYEIEVTEVLPGYF